MLVTSNPGFHSWFSLTALEKNWMDFVSWFWRKMSSSLRVWGNAQTTITLICGRGGSRNPCKSLAFSFVWLLCWAERKWSNVFPESCCPCTWELGQCQSFPSYPSIFLVLCGNSLYWVFISSQVVDELLSKYCIDTPCADVKWPHSVMQLIVSKHALLWTETQS